MVGTLCLGQLAEHDVSTAMLANPGQRHLDGQ